MGGWGEFGRKRIGVILITNIFIYILSNIRQKKIQLNFSKIFETLPLLMDNKDKKRREAMFLKLDVNKNNILSFSEVFSGMKHYISEKDMTTLKMPFLRSYMITKDF